MAILEATLWDNGSEGYGIKINKEDRIHFPKPSNKIIIYFDDKNDINFFNISRSFWYPKNPNAPCSEIRSEKFKFWADKHNLQTGDKALLKIIKPLEEYRLIEK